MSRQVGFEKYDKERCVALQFNWKKSFPENFSSSSFWKWSSFCISTKQNCINGKLAFKTCYTVTFLVDRDTARPLLCSHVFLVLSYIVAD